MSKDTGGPAFPHPDFASYGMTLRDYFAAAALAEVPDPQSISDAPATAKLAYAIADAMLVERAEGMKA